MTRKFPKRLQELLPAHLNEIALCHEWTRKAIRHRRDGETSKAERAEQRVIRCMQRIRLLEELSNGVLQRLPPREERLADN